MTVKDLATSPVYTITPARPKDLAMLPAIELAAAGLLVGHAPESVLNETTSDEVLKTAQRHGHLWVALADDVPVGFARIEVIEPTVAHLEEIDVHPQHGRRGLGTKLVRATCAWAIAAGYHSVTLTVPRRRVEHAVLCATRIRGDSVGGAQSCLAFGRPRRNPSRPRSDATVAMRRPCAVY